MVGQITEKPGPSRPRFQTVRHARNSKHDVPCGESCLIYPKGKKDHTPNGFLGKVTRYLELDLKTRPLRKSWVEQEGKKRRRGGRHRDCDQPNRDHPVTEDTVEEEELLDIDADEGGDVVMNGGNASASAAAAAPAAPVAVAVAVAREHGEDGGEPVYQPARALPAVELRPADEEVALAWARRDSQEHHYRPDDDDDDDDDDEVRAMIAEPGQQDRRRAIVDPYVEHGDRGPTGRMETLHVRRVGIDDDDPVVVLHQQRPSRGFVRRLVPYRLVAGRP